MVLTIQLSPDLEQRLSREAERQGLSVAAYVTRLLEQHIAAPDRPTELVALLQSWLDNKAGDEQIETGALLIEAIDADRLSDRKLFPSELEGVTW